MNLRQWKGDGKRAPHKPLLLLYALARFAEGVGQLAFNTVEPALLRLLEGFGPSRKKRTAFPFWRLENDGSASVGRTSSGDMLLTEARLENPVARFPADMAHVLRANLEMVPELVDALMESHFPTTLHERQGCLGAAHLRLRLRAHGVRVWPHLARTSLTRSGWRAS